MVACCFSLCGALAGCGALAESASETATAAEEDGFEQILGQQNGRYTKHGWNHYGPGHFELDSETGVLTSHDGMGLFWYAAREYADFVLELEFKCEDERTNSGIFVRVPGVPVSDDYIFHSFEIQIDERGQGIHGTGAVYDAEAPSDRVANPPGVWNHYRIAFIGDRLSVELNGKRVVDWTAEPRGKVADFAPRGYIGLQNHDPHSSVYFRNIRVREVREEEADPGTGGGNAVLDGAASAQGIRVSQVIDASVAVPAARNESICRSPGASPSGSLASRS
jgi:hypothetical protein